MKLNHSTLNLHTIVWPRLGQLATQIFLNPISHHNIKLLAHNNSSITLPEIFHVPQRIEDGSSNFKILSSKFNFLSLQELNLLNLDYNPYSKFTYTNKDSFFNKVRDLFLEQSGSKVDLDHTPQLRSITPTIPLQQIFYQPRNTSISSNEPRLHLYNNPQTQRTRKKQENLFHTIWKKLINWLFAHNLKSVLNNT